VLSYSNVNNVKNISLHEDVFASIVRKVNNKLPSDTESHLSSKATECSWSHSGWEWQSWGRHDGEGTKAKDFKWL